jgi:predicted GNAT superfamily acetyltransferase
MSPDDLERALEINQGNLADVDSITIDDLGRVLGDSKIALVAVEPEGAVVGFCLIIDESCGYLSERAAWALSTAGPGLHIDRVVFDMRFSGFGLGLALYNELDRRIAALAAATDSGTTTLTSLVRIDPPNQHSVSFHNARGFLMVDESMFDGQKFALASRAYQP